MEHSSPFGAMNKGLLLNLIDLSSNDAERNAKDESAGRMIFDQCCNYKGMKEHVISIRAQSDTYAKKYVAKWKSNDQKKAQCSKSDDAS